MALWGGRFSEAGRAELTEFSESISFDKRLYKHDIAGSKAHVAMLASRGIIPAATAEAIAGQLDLIRTRIEAGEMEFKAELEDIHMHIESALIMAIGDEGARLHSARSRNDQVALDIRLYLRDEIDQLRQEIIEFQRALVDLGLRHDKTIMPGFTHLQHAQVVLFAHHLLAYVEMFGRDIERLEDSAAGSM
ncbi:Argininosuccinate lyase [bioreactor metagenome]|uniref:Argininosuccinate lyase n=1 Tax=bioreactor metagenome TaxID=1076179 RepID=A0A645D1A0_9ZZZZ